MNDEHDMTYTGDIERVPICGEITLNSELKRFPLDPEQAFIIENGDVKMSHSQYLSLARCWHEKHGDKDSPEFEENFKRHGKNVYKKSAYAGWLWGKNLRDKLTFQCSELEIYKFVCKQQAKEIAELKGVMDGTYDHWTVTPPHATLIPDGEKL